MALSAVVLAQRPCAIKYPARRNLNVSSFLRFPEKRAFALKPGLVYLECLCICKEVS